ncbi:MAG: FMN-binding protein [Candidatus Omnitrophica bacterium]|jgi:electron transport complex protein RnfG|nr:FMN-binding protein [Candidatus Omnitrophota bacterium]
MKQTIRYGLVLFIVCSVASGLLAGVNAMTKDKIARQLKLEEEASLKEVMPMAARFQAVDKAGYYQAYDQKDNLIGVCFKAQGKGYSSVIEVMVGMFNDGTINAIKVLSLNETPGLGSKVAEDDFISRFRSCKDLNQVQAISGATISSRAVIEAVKIKSQQIKELMKNGR